MDQIHRTVRIPALRGKILDRNQLVLAENKPSYNINLYLEELRPSFTYEYTNSVKKRWLAENPQRPLTSEIRKNLERESRYRAVSNVVYRVGVALQTSLVLDEKKFHAHYTESRSRPLTTLQNLSSLQIARFLERKEISPGLDLETQPVRFYPHTNLAAHVLGYLKRDDSSKENEEAFVNYRMNDFKGVVGIEATFDAELRGRAGVKSVLVNSQGYRESENIWTPAGPGKNVILTLDFAIQQATENAFHSTGVNTFGAALVLDARNGNILALASLPSFDPNFFLGRIPIAEWNQLNDPKIRPLINRATKEDYPPGSIFKIVVALAGLESGTLNPAEIFQSEGEYRVSPRAKPIHDLAAPGPYDFRRAFIKSSNSYFIEHGLRAGIEKILEMGARFHLGEKTEIPLNQETAGLFLNSPTEKKRYFPGESWTRGDTANLSIGQGLIDVTALQMAVMTAAVCNGGKIFRPRLVHSVVSPEILQNEAPQIFPIELRGELNVQPKNLEIVKEAMLGDVADAEGTAFAAFHEADKKTPLLPTMRIGGKTGTAQKRAGSKDYITWFTSFGFTDSISANPAREPAYVVVVMVEHG
ncbi:MAG: penicillin-binding transpeptidase domain-containing protein, partial [Limisphaerales bacterium]